MARVKPKYGHSPFPIPTGIVWTDEAKEQLGDDLYLDLDQPGCMQWRDEMLAELAETLEDHDAWGEHRRNYPTPASRRSEFIDLLPVLDAAFTQLNVLSSAALADLKNTHAYWKDEETLVEKHNYIDVRSLNHNIQDGLAILIARIKLAIKNSPPERRGRKPSARPVLEEKLSTIFDIFYKGEKRSRQEARKLFIKDVLELSKKNTASG